MKAAEIRVSLQRPLQHRNPAMAPTLTPVMSECRCQDHVTLTHKLRKPLVEKIRRERINSSAEQLKSLLGPEFLKQQPDSKLEKADILAYCKDWSNSVNLWTQQLLRATQDVFKSWCMSC
ncbi:unnamed protein product [Oreochromis niloticus]|nr:unnamed protein product [Mustela putorius furo]